jgi:hypothetical protein
LHISHHLGSTVSNEIVNLNYGIRYRSALLVVFLLSVFCNKLSIQKNKRKVIYETAVSLASRIIA